MKFYMALIIAVLGIGLVTSTVSAQDEIDYTEMVEDLKVMCRIVDETMDETFENDYVKGGFFRRGGCQHLYLKGYGAMFLLDVRFPVAEKEMKIVKTEKETNLWEKHEREIRHQDQLEEAAWVVGKNESYSKEKVGKLKEQLAYLVGEYGSRIGQLTLDDTISFVVFGYPDYTIDLETDFLVEMHVVEHVGADAMSHTREALSHAREALSHARETLHTRETLEETEDKLQAAVEKMEELKEKIAEQASQDGDKAEEKDEEMKDLEPEKVKRFRIPIPPTPPTPPSLPHRLHRKPVTTLILTFKRSQLEGKNGTDWEALLKAAEVVEY